MIDSLASLLVAGAQRTPDAPVLIDRDPDGTPITVTYAQAEERTAIVAQLLVAAGVAPGDRVMIAKRKGMCSFMAVHGILRAGAVVVPLDPLAPAPALQPLVANARPTAVIGDPSVIAKLDLDTTAPDLRLVIEEVTQELAGTVADVAVPEPLTGEHPAYIIYSSGSTGVPKGILHSHASGLAYAAMCAEEYGLTASDRLAAMTPLHFDMSTLELYALPFVGGSSAMFSEAELRFPATFTDRAAAARCTIWYAVPYMLQQIVERGALDERDLSTLATIAYGGEVYPVEGLRRLMELFPGVLVTNVYGPAEVNAITHHHLTEPPAAGVFETPLGVPAMGVEAMVVDDDRTTPLPIGETGELVVSAPTRMIEYWERPDLDAATRLARSDGPDWYRTGDLVRLDDEGVLWFAGRRDHQVKVRGVRLELDSIEAVVAAAPGVLHAVVGPNEASDALLAAVVMRDDAEFDERSLRRWVSARVSAGALPASFVERASMPATSSGKIDVRRVRIELATSNEQMEGIDGDSSG
ncbi:MAG: AMP-binding protein [Acidimicrobiales bacterium]